MAAQNADCGRKYEPGSVGGRRGGQGGNFSRRGIFEMGERRYERGGNFEIDEGRDGQGWSNFGIGGRRSGQGRNFGSFGRRDGNFEGGGEHDFGIGRQEGDFEMGEGRGGQGGNFSRRGNFEIGERRHERGGNFEIDEGRDGQGWSNFGIGGRRSRQGRNFGSFERRGGNFEGGGEQDFGIGRQEGDFEMSEGRGGQGGLNFEIGGRRGGRSRNFERRCGRGGKSGRRGGQGGNFERGGEQGGNFERGGQEGDFEMGGEQGEISGRRDGRSRNFERRGGQGGNFGRGGEEDGNFGIGRGGQEGNFEMGGARFRRSDRNLEMDRRRGGADRNFEGKIRGFYGGNQRGQGRGGHFGQIPGRSQPRLSDYLSKEDLQAMSQGNPEDIQVCISANEAKFLNTYKKENYCSHPLTLKQMIKLLHLLVKCEDRRITSNMLAQILCASGDYANFMTSIDKLLKDMALEKRGHVRRDNPSCISHLIDIGLLAIKMIPSTVLSTFPVLVIEKTMQELAEQNERMDTIAEKFQELADNFKLERTKALKEVSKVKFKPYNDLESSSDSEGEPPNSFTEISILPKLMELRSSEPFLRKNKVKGAYKNWEHYLDVHFRLLREDFLGPLSDGIFTLVEENKRTADIRIYEDAKILNPVCLFVGIGFQLRFNSSRLKHINWEHSSRLIYGSLLCLSNDHFRENMVFATVLKRDPKLLTEGLIMVKFEDDFNAFSIDPKESFEMIESTAYFEAYRHILVGLQEICTFPDAIPMKKYIVDCDTSDVRIPTFLSLPSKPPYFDMDMIMKNPRGTIFDVTIPNLWPSVKHSNLDESQLEALKAALSSEVSVIQGPPGTGKTFIGLKIAEAYLKNRDIWDPEHSSPILVVCYTNHALDQFLEGIQKIEVRRQTQTRDTKPNIIRVGGRCKSDALTDCILSKKTQKCRSEKKLPRHMHQSSKWALREIYAAQKSISKKMGSYEADSDKIIPLNDLRQVMKPEHFHQLELGGNSKEIEEWLGLWFPEKDQVPTPKSTPAEYLLPPVYIPDEPVANKELNGDELINVDNEAQVLHEARAIEGEEIELLPYIMQEQRHSNAQPEVQYKTTTKDDQGWTTIQLAGKQQKKLIAKGLKSEPMSQLSAFRVRNVWTLDEKKRWRLYVYWVNQYLKACKDSVNVVASEYNKSCTDYNECQREIDCYVAKDADVVGMTTTGAAKYKHLLKRICPKIVIFEEAAEVLEAHIITSLSPSVKQLIMIGDHKQLRPKPTSYELETKYNLGISLFERLIMNGFPSVTLEVQHRMRPEVSGLIRRSIYETLVDDDSVKCTAEKCSKKHICHISGVEKDVFFVNHINFEEDYEHQDIKTHVNKFEAKYTVELCRYLLKQGYGPRQITILTMYKGQLLELRKLMKREHFEGVRVAAVDDFQGEENDIILLSLVRSNRVKDIGFLSIENRVCVALSRAKRGLYVIGNLSVLKEKKKTVWPKIIRYLEENNCVGSGLPLVCPVHKSDKIIAKIPEDFMKRPEGGCNKICDTRLKCGHVCDRLCHVKDQDHKQSICNKVCSKQLECGHTCKAKCHQCKKNGRCLPCRKLVLKTTPQCNHSIKVHCSTNVSLMPCPKPCDKLLPCGHLCQNHCSEPCSEKCYEKVQRTLSCKHTVELPCFQDPRSIACPVKCKEMLECGDRCSGTCGECQHGHLHIKCKKKCGRDLMCGHPCDYPCASICPPCMKPCNNYCIHSKCPKKCYEPCDPCMEKCEWQCDHFKCTKPCGQLCDRPPCDLPCQKILRCGHQCIGLCGEKCPKKCRICNKDEVCAIFFGNEDEDGALFIELQDCGHIFEVSGLDHWIETDTSSSADSPSSSSSQVMFKECPRCRTQIRKSLRYGNKIKSVLKDVEGVKAKQITSSAEIEPVIREVLYEVRDLDFAFVKPELDNINKEINEGKGNTLNSFRVATMKFQLSILPKLLKLKTLHYNLKPIDGTVKKTGRYIDEKLNNLKIFIMQEFLSAQQISDGIFELRRLTCLAKLLDLLCKLKMKQCQMSEVDYYEITRQVKDVQKSKVNKEKEEQIYQLIKDYSKKYEVDGLSESERLEIVAAIGLSKGHWYKCPKGHYYCIGECGGAMETGTCPECKSTIGGRSHQLASGNIHAGEMDGSHHAAWSDAANLENFDPAELARLRFF